MVQTPVSESTCSRKSPRLRRTPLVTDRIDSWTSDQEASRAAIAAQICWAAARSIPRPVARLTTGNSSSSPILR